jgi:uncharacterized protein YbjQ (UPF0145 family)
MRWRRLPRAHAPGALLAMRIRSGSTAPWHAASRRLTLMIMSTTPSIEGRPASRYLGVVTGEAIIGANVFRDIFAAVRDIVGGRSATYERALAEARETAMREMAQQAEQLGANAVVGIDLDYEVLGQSNGMLMVSVSGTAIVC